MPSGRHDSQAYDVTEAEPAVGWALYFTTSLPSVFGFAAEQTVGSTAVIALSTMPVGLVTDTGAEVAAQPVPPSVLPR